MFRSQCLFLLIVSVLFPKAIIAATPSWIDLPEDDYAKLARFEDDRFNTLTLSVKRYHSIPKNMKSKLQDRIYELKNISNFLAYWIDCEELKYRKKFLSNIHGIALNKKWYLEKLYDRFSTGQFSMESLRRFHHDLCGSKGKYEPIYLNHQRFYDSALGIYWGEFWFETIDPCHRQLTPYYDLWIKNTSSHKDLGELDVQVSNLENTDFLFDFFLWLEDQNLSKDIPYIDFINRHQLKECIVIIENGLLYLPHESGMKLVDYHESNQEYIFNVTLSEQLLLAPSSKTIHHVSFSHGKPVLGAGNMTVYQGKIATIELESGHYLPEPHHGIQVLEVFKNIGIQLIASFLKKQ